MIKIPNLAPSVKKEIEDNHWEFFLVYCLMEFYTSLTSCNYGKDVIDKLITHNDKINIEINDIENIIKETDKDKIKNLINYFQQKHKNGVIYNMVIGEKKELDIFIKILPKTTNTDDNDIFKVKIGELYKIFRDGRIRKMKNHWGAVCLTYKLGLSVCPYCNRNYLIQYENKNKKQKITAEIDHFYDKSTYPFLALSLYNLIPSCSTCNHLKGTKGDILYPYEFSFDDKGVKFEVDKPSMAFKIKPKEEDFEIILKNKKTCIEIEKAVDEVFYLEEMYKVHKSDVVDIYYKERIINSNNIDSLKTILKCSKEDINEIIEDYKGNSNKYHKKPLAKLNKDIREQITKQPSTKKP